MAFTADTGDHKVTRIRHLPRGSHGADRGLAEEPQPQRRGAARR